jgi:hypothetical protein
VVFSVVIFLSQLKVPVILAGCKVDLSDKQQQAGLENVLDFIMCTFREVEIYLECSALHRIKVKCVVKAEFSSKLFLKKLSTFLSHQNFPTHTNFQLFRHIVPISTKLLILA